MSKASSKRRMAWTAGGLVGGLVVLSTLWIGLRYVRPYAECELRMQLWPTARQSAECFQNVERRGGDRDSAMARLDAHLQEDRPWVHFVLGTYEWGLNPCPHLEKGACAHFDAALDELRGELRGGKTADAFDVALRAARCYSDTKDLKSADQRFTDAESWLQGDPERQARLDIETADSLAYHERGVGEAWGLLDRLPVSDFDADLERRYWAVKAFVAHALGQPRQALRPLKWLIEDRQHQGLACREMRSRYNYVVASLEVELPGQKLLDELRPHSSRLRQLASSGACTEPRLVAQTERIEGKLSQLPEAQVHLDECLRLAQGNDQLRLEAECAAALANKLATRDPRAALEYWQHAEAMSAEASKAANPQLDLFLWPEQFGVLWQTLDRATALDKIDRTLAEIERRSSVQQEDLGRAGVFSVWAPAYAWLAGRWLEDEPVSEHSMARAFELLERVRSRGLRGARWQSPDPNPNLRKLIDLPAAQAILQHDEAALVFQYGLDTNAYGDFEGGSWLLVIPASGPVERFPLPGRELLEMRLQLFNAASESLTQLFQPFGTEVYEELLGPAIAKLNGMRHLILLLDGDLHQVPFGRWQAKDQPLSGFAVSQAPSMTVLRELRSMPESGDQVLIFASPPAFEIPAGADRLDLAWADVNEQALGKLEFAAAEGRSLQDLFGQSSSELLQDTDASEARLQDLDLAPYKVLHFAAHAIVDQVNPDHSAVILAAGDGHDGLLHPKEIAELELDGKMIVLAACDGANGLVLRGEGVLGLAHAFFRAGARTVVASRQRLDDRATAATMEEFYRQLLSGVSAAEALRQVRLEGQGLGLRVLGDGSFRPFPNRSASRSWQQH